MLQNKRVLLGITGSIAAYKAAILVRMFIKNGADVKVVMTPSATKFISPLTISTLSGHKVSVDWEDEGTWSNHVDLGLWADIMVVAPCTASTLSKMVNGNADNMLLACYLSAKCPVVIAPAMDLDMWRHSATQANIKTMVNFGHQIIPVEFGFLASGLIGDGRMAEPEHIIDFITKFFQKDQPYIGKKVLITAGPTHEPLDPVRFIGNHSSGKMGISIAKAFVESGAEVTLILGPTSIQPDNTIHKVERIQTSDQMFEKVQQYFAQSDIIILAAAVADYKPAHVSDVKMKKKDDELVLELKKTIDIAAHFGTKKTDNQVFVGFALETNDEIVNAKSKLNKKNFDFIVLNSMADPGAGFAHDTNRITILDKNGDITNFDLKSKTEVAFDIVNYLSSNFLK